MIDFFTRIVEMFKQEPDITRMGFLSTFFRVVPGSFTDADEIEYDIVRSGAEIAPAVPNLNAEAVSIALDKFTNKKAEFPVYTLDSPADIHSLMARRPGENAYLTGTERVNWLARFASVMVPAFAKMTRMIRNSIEYQAAQVLQTGKIELTDENGVTTYSENFFPKATHFPTVSISWGESGADPVQDCKNLMSVIRKDGFVDIKRLVFGEAAWDKFFRDTWVQENLKQDYLGVGGLDPRLADKGAAYMGYLFIGQYKVELWCYDGFYTPWKTANAVNFLDPDKVLFLPDLPVLDFRRYFGGYPNIKIDPVFDPLFGNKIPIDNEYDFFARVYMDEKRRTYIGEVGSRPFMCPVSIDRYGCLTVVA
jgi:hypothetical protein